MTLQQQVKELKCHGTYSFPSECIITGSNIEEEFAATLQILGYPYSLINSSLKPVISPHSWQILIGVLIWLIDVSLCMCLRMSECLCACVCACTPPVQ